MKIHMLTDVLGRPLRFIVTAGQAADSPQAAGLLHGQTGSTVLADRAYDSNALRDVIAGMGANDQSCTTPPPTNFATVSNDASVVSNTSDASQHATNVEPSTSSASYTSPPSWNG